MTGIFRYILIPFSYPYYFAVRVRNLLYDKCIFKCYKSPLTIISTGNITSGGSGKTPLAINIASRLMSEGYKIALLSRGYKRKSKGIVVVYDGKEITTDIGHSGDEAYMTVKSLLENYSGFYLLVAENRIEGVKYIEDNYKADFIILDDAFQHRNIFRNTDILVIDSNDYIKHKFFYKYLLPAGNLREPFNNIKRASVIVQNDKISPADTLPELSAMNLPVFHSEYSVKGIFNHKKETASINKKNILAFSGIANPVSFLDIIKKNGGEIYQELRFSDHHKYSSEDTEKISRYYRQDSLILTTQKDFVKITEFDKFVNDYPVYYIKINMEIKNQDEFYKILL
ncbi:MAG: tetraacyldisaccharide 4'-kinase [Ignavibacteria bacterium]|nr:tetraacyldisaccharide 4'-kinase [Ignavibacteria bacterium]